MKNKLKILSVLSIAGACAALGLAATNPTPAYAMPIQGEHLLMSSGDVNLNTTNYIRKVPKSWVTEGTVEYGGLTYDVDANRNLMAKIASNPESVTELILYYSFGNGRVTYTNIDWSRYTNLTDVVVVANNMDPFTSILQALPTGTNLYVSGGLNFGTALQTMPFENLYLCTPYSMSINTISSNSFTSNLTLSRLKHIYYDGFNEVHESYNIEHFANAYKNKNDETITIEKATNIKYPKEVFYPFEAFSEASTVLGSKGYYFTSGSSQISFMVNFTEKVTETDDRVVDLVLNTIGCGNDLDSSKEYGTLYFKNLSSFNFSSCHAEEVIFEPKVNTSLTINYFSNIKRIRILPYKRTATFSGTISSLSKLEKILIPKSQESDYADLLANASYQGKVELYDDETYQLPTSSSYRVDDKLIHVSQNTSNIDDVEYMRANLDALHIDYQNKEVDTITALYEFPNKETYLENKYDIRSINRIIVPKDINAKDVLNEFKDVLVTNNGRTCDPTGFKIKTIDDSEYTLGYNGNLTVTVEFADSTTKTFEVDVRCMNVNSKYAYIMDSNNNINVIGPKTSEQTELSVLLEPLMENYLMERNVEYSPSEILDTTSPTFNAGNQYKASASEGKIRVLLNNETPNSETPIDNPSDEPGDTPTTTDTDEVDTEGYVMKNITKIYTPESIDGSKLLAGLRNDMLTKDGEPEEVSFAIGYNNHTNKEPWSFTIFETITKGDKYRKKVDVEIINHSLNMGFVMFEDGTIAVEYNTLERYTPTQIKEGIVEFLNSQNINSENVTIPNEFRSNGVFYGTYSGGKLILVDSGYNLSYTTEDLPTDQTKEMEGYHAFHTIYYTDNFTVEEALRAVSRNFILKDGKKVENYSIEFTTNENSKNVSYIIKDGETELLKGSVAMQKIESDYQYIFGHMFGFDYGYLVIEKASKAPEYKIDDVIKDGLSHFRGLLKPFDSDTEIDFTKVESKEIKGVYQLGNGAYYSYEYDVDVVDLDHVVRTNECTVDGIAQTGETFVDKAKDFFNDFKTKFEDNKAFKVGAIALGSITGLLILYGLYVLIRKMFKWFKK